MTLWMIGDLPAVNDARAVWKDSLDLALSVAVLNGHGMLFLFSKDDGAVRRLPANGLLLRFGRVCIKRALPAWPDGPKSLSQFLEQPSWSSFDNRPWSRLPQPAKDVVMALLAYQTAISPFCWSVASQINSVRQYAANALSRGPDPDWMSKEAVDAWQKEREARYNAHWAWMTAQLRAIVLKNMDKSEPVQT